MEIKTSITCYFLVLLFLVITDSIIWNNLKETSFAIQCIKYYANVSKL